MSRRKARQHIENTKPKQSLSRRAAIVGLLAAGGIAIEEASIGFLRKRLFKKEEARETTEPKKEVETVDGEVASLEDKLAPLTQQNLVYPESAQDALELHKFSYQASKGRQEALVKGFHIGALDSDNNFSNEDKQRIKELFGDLYETGFLADFKRLKAENQNIKKPGKLILIPFVHGDSSIDHKNTDSAAYKSYKNVIGILELLSTLPHKIFYESLDNDEQYTVDKVRQKIIALIRQYDDSLSPEEMESAVKMAMEKHKKTFYGLAQDPRFRIFGLEHARLKDFVDKQRAFFRQNMNLMYIGTLLDGILREQYAIERAINKTDSDETGIIVIGALHIPTMVQYLQETHPNVKSRVIVPKYLY